MFWVGGRLPRRTTIRVHPYNIQTKAGVGGQGFYISPAHDAVVVWFSTGKQLEEILARTIAESL